MRKTLMIATAAVALLSAPAFAAPYDDGYNPAAPAEVTTGAVAGTAVGVGVSEGWFGATAAGVALPTTAVGAAATGGVVGVGAAAGIDAIIQPCRGVSALLGLNKAQCAQRQAALDANYAGGPHRRVVRR
jgi:hypothetical protein